MWLPILISILGSAGFTGFCVWLLKKSITQKYDEKLKRLESQLEQANFIFSHTFPKTSASIESIHAKLLELKKSLDDFSHSRLGTDRTGTINLMIKFHESYRDFSILFQSNKLFTNQETAAMIQKYVSELWDIMRISDHLEAWKKHIERTNNYSESATDSLEQFGNSLTVHVRKAETSFQELENHFRKVLGVKSEANPK